MLTPEKILLAGVEKGSLALLKSALGQEFEIEIAEDSDSALAAMHRVTISAVLLGAEGPEDKTRDFLDRRLRDQALTQTPVLIVRRGSAAARQRKAMQLGAWDYVSPDDDPEIIRLRVHLAILHSDQASYRRLCFLAHYDPLTETYNKKTFFEAASALLQDHPETRFAFIRFDIDNFKLINRFFGTEEGDRLLRYLAGRIPAYVQKYGIYAYGRIERDVFGICVPYSPQIEADMQHIRARLVQNEWNYSIVPSFGVYIITDPAESMDRVYNCAGIAAETRKGRYFQCWAYYDEAMEEQIRREQEIQNGMAQALDNGRFTVYLQPKYDLQDDRVAGAEALVRWIDEEKGIIAPNDFVPLFEKNGFIAKLDYFVWESVCRYLHSWLAAGKTPLPISVNVSRVDLCDIGITDRIVALTKQYDVPPRYLNLEITESAYSTNPELVKTISAALQLNGFKVLMDDFGSGYSSLNVLKDINIDELKLDMRFFSGDHDTRRGEDIVVAMIHMAKWLHIPVIAEGVETEQQAAFLRRAGCEYVQGYYFGRPAPVPVYADALADGGNTPVPEKASPSMGDAAKLQEDMFSEMAAGMALCEFTGDAVYLRRTNPAFEHFIIGLGRSEDPCGDFLQQLPAAEREELLSMLYKTEFSRGTVQFEHGFERPDGSHLWADVTLRFLARTGGTCLQTLTVCDITAQKQFQQQNTN